MSEAAWNKAFTQGSRALQDRLKKVHASNPKFQAWMQKSGHGAGASVKQASKEVKPSARVKSLQTKSLQAYGATKGAKVGGEHGSGEMRDTIAPLTRDQHSKVQAAERASKAAAKAAAPKAKKPLSKAQRMAAIAAAVRKSKTKHDVPTVDPDDMDHDDLRDLHQSLHVSRSYNEEVELDEMDKSQPSSSRGAEGLALGKKADPVKTDKVKSDALKLLQKQYKKVKEEVEVDESVATAQKVMDRANVVAKTNPDPKKRFAASGLAQKAMMRTINPTGINTGIVRGGGNKTYRMVTGKVPPYQLTKKTGVSEEVELDEVTKQEAEKMLGGPVKTRTGSEPKGKLPLGFRRARNLARKAMKTVKESTTEVLEVNEMNHGKKLAKMIMAKQSQHPIAQNMGEENIVEQDDSMEKKEMAQTQLHFIKYAAEEILAFIDMGGEVEEWYQNKLSKVQSEVESLHSYIEGEKRRTGMVEEVEQVDEKMNLVKAKMGDVVKDFYKSKAPQFKGKSMAKRREMAVAAKLGAEREAGMREEVEQVDEQSPAEIKAKYYHDQFDKVKPVKAYDKEGKLVGRYRSMDHAKQMKPGHTYKVEEEVVAEAEGKVAVTPKEKSLAAHHGDKTRITYGDVIKARLKSAAAKKMGNK